MVALAPSFSNYRLLFLVIESLPQRNMGIKEGATVAGQAKQWVLRPSHCVCLPSPAQTTVTDLTGINSIT